MKYLDHVPDDEIVELNIPTGIPLVYELDGDLNRYSSIIRDLAAKNNLRLVDLRKAFLEYNLANNPGNKESGILTTDRVHLNEAGNRLVAEKMWEAIRGL